MGARINYTTGQVLGNKITFLKDVLNKVNRTALFKCHCGNIFESNVDNIKRKQTTSCGCLYKLHMDSKKLDSLYTTWQGIKSRCYNSNNIGYKYYGGKNITVFNKWIDSYVEFKKYIVDNIGPFNIITHMFDRPPKNWTIDRIENLHNYEPNNIKWSTKHQQTLNSNVSKLTLKEINKIKYLLINTSLTQAEIANDFNVTVGTISNINTGGTHSKLKQLWK